jgi:hypothetical protein
MSSTKCAPLEFKPDLEESARRWDAYIAGELIDRPVVCVNAYYPDRQGRAGHNYHDLVYGDMDYVIETALLNAWATWHGGESTPAACFSFGPDEIAVYCGAELEFAPDSGNTNWSHPFVENWAEALPLRFNEQHPLWQRQLEFYRRAAVKTAGKMLLSPIDLHTNMDILAPIRGSQRLCMDLLDTPELIDRAMADARAIFPKVWYGVAEAARMAERGYSGGAIYSMEGSATLSCDFCCMVSPAMFRRWILPALEEEAAIVKHAFYHWDGPGALKHIDALCESKALHTLGYVPTVSPETENRMMHIRCLDLFKECQRRGKAMQFIGTPEECKLAHRELDPRKVMYCTWTETPEAGEELLKWFVKHT